MAVKQSGAKRRKASRKRRPTTMNQFATTARRRTKKLRHEAETAVQTAGDWVGDTASMIGDGIKRQPVLTGVLAAAVGVIGWLLGRQSASAGR